MVIVLCGLAVVLGGLAWGLHLRSDAIGDLTAPPCAPGLTAGAAREADCVVTETGLVADRRHAPAVSSDDGDIRTLTVSRGAARTDHQVDEAFYASVRTGDTVDVKSWKGEVSRLEHAGHSYRVRSPFTVVGALALLVVTSGIVLTVATLKRAGAGRTAFALLWFSLWEGPPLLGLLGSTSPWALLLLLWAAVGVLGLAAL
ncbi:hypothetical protein [Kitasatospora sp. NPDC088134]|uniref:hypothetical protein n=1 Tax=Kitasatospora sp. NPDC088134 TaxID=3364071 RepID=UPI0037F3095A